MKGKKNETKYYNNIAFISPTFGARKEPFAAVAFINQNKLDERISRRAPNTSRTNEKKTHFDGKSKECPAVFFMENERSSEAISHLYFVG